MKIFTDEPLWQVRAWFLSQLNKGEPGIIECLAPDPDPGAGRYPGETLCYAGKRLRHRGFRTWLDLAETLDLRLLTPRPAEAPLLHLRFQTLDKTRSWHVDPVVDNTEKYGPYSGFARLQKLEEPWFLNDYLSALARLDLPREARILDLGINNGDEFAAFPLVFPKQAMEAWRFTGVDHAAGAVETARRRFPEPNYCFHCHDINALWDLNLPPQDLVVAVGTLQSPGIDSKDLVMQLRKRLLTPQGAMILGFPNVRYLDGELKPGARLKNYSEPELSLLVKDLFFYRRYLQQSGFRVVLTGKYYIFLTAFK